MVFVKNKVCGLLGFLFACFFLISFSSAASDTLVTITFSGCTFSEGSENIFVRTGECSDGDHWGEYFCGPSDEHWITTDVNYGCTRGSTSITPVPSEGYCCPAGYFCNETSGKFKCDLRLTPCNASLPDGTGSGECGGPGIRGVYYGGSCICSMADQTCATYVDQTNCDNDTLNVPKVDVTDSYVDCLGAEFVISDAECYWNGTVCQSRNNVTEDYNASGISFSCSNTFELGVCNDEGRQNVTWTSNYTNESGLVTPELLACVGCDGGELTRACGEPIIKLSGFSLFALLLSFFVIGIYYFITHRFKYRRAYRLL